MLVRLVFRLQKSIPRTENLRAPWTRKNPSPEGLLQEETAFLKELEDPVAYVFSIFAR